MPHELSETRDRKSKGLRRTLEGFKICELKLIQSALRRDTRWFNENQEMRHLVGTVIKCNKYYRGE